MASVISQDGTQIVYDVEGEGKPVILVAGATATRAFGFSDLVQLLSNDFMVYNYDRRGRGESDDTQPFAVAREVEDLEALIDAAGGSAMVYGISSGGALALEAAMSLGDKITKLAIYEVPYDSSPEDLPLWHEYYTTLKQLIADGKNGEAIEHFMNFLKVPAEMVNGMKSSPMWPALQAVAPTLVYDAEAMGGTNRKVPAQRAAQLTIPVLLMDGEASQAVYPNMKAAADELAAAMPQARRETLPGQGHDVDARVLGPILAAFFAES